MRLIWDKEPANLCAGCFWENILMLCGFFALCEIFFIPSMMGGILIDLIDPQRNTGMRTI